MSTIDISYRTEIEKVNSVLFIILSNSRGKMCSRLWIRANVDRYINDLDYLSNFIDETWLIIEKCLVDLHHVDSNQYASIFK